MHSAPRIIASRILNQLLSTVTNSHIISYGGRALRPIERRVFPGDRPSEESPLTRVDRILQYLYMQANVSELQAFKAEFFRALAHPIRIRILEILVASDKSVQALQDALGAGQPIVSQQLAVLRAKNIVVARKEGTTVRYSVRDRLLADLLDVARRIFNNQLVGTQTLLRELKREARRR